MQIVCPKCGKRYKVKQEFSGKKVKCAKCETSFVAETVEIPPVRAAKPQPKSAPATQPPPEPPKAQVSPVTPLTPQPTQEPKPAAPAAKKLKVCANCQSKIGRLESQHKIKGGIVCAICYDKLSQDHTKVKGHVTTELTAKKWKARKIIGIALLIAGTIWTSCSAAVETNSESTSGFVIGPCMIIVGLIIYIHARIKAWWHHG